jgi:hypothetical protein
MTLYSLQWWFSFYCVLGAAAVLPLGLLAVFGHRSHAVAGGAGRGA